MESNIAWMQIGGFGESTCGFILHINPGGLTFWITSFNFYVSLPNLGVCRTSFFVLMKEAYSFKLLPERQCRILHTHTFGILRYKNFGSWRDNTRCIRAVTGNISCHVRWKEAKENVSVWITVGWMVFPAKLLIDKKRSIHVCNY